MTKLHTLLLAVPLALLAGTFELAAHELRVAASPFASTPGGQATVYLSWGHSLADDNFLDAESLERYAILSPGGVSSPLQAAGFSAQVNRVRLAEPGVYQVVAARHPAVLTFVIDAEGNRVLRRGPKSGITEGTIDIAQRSRHAAKALVVVGPPQPAAIEPAGLPVEIVPLDGPADWRAGRDVRCQVLVEGKPAAGELLLATYAGFEPEEAWCYAIATDREGTATVRPQQAGVWTLMVRSRKLTAGDTREEYDFDSYTATLTLEIRP